jgi:hypothetical protein
MKALSHYSPSFPIQIRFVVVVAGLVMVDRGCLVDGRCESRYIALNDMFPHLPVQIHTRPIHFNVDNPAQLFIDPLHYNWKLYIEKVQWTMGKEDRERKKSIPPKVKSISNLHAFNKTLYSHNEYTQRSTFRRTTTDTSSGASCWVYVNDPLSRSQDRASCCSGSSCAIVALLQPVKASNSRSTTSAKIILQ